MAFLNWVKFGSHSSLVLLTHLGKPSLALVFFSLPFVDSVFGWHLMLEIWTFSQLRWRF